MMRSTRTAVGGAVLGVFLAVSPAPTDAAPALSDPEFTSEFGLESLDLRTTGNSRFFSLQPGVRLLLSGFDGDERQDVMITVTQATYWIDGVETRLVTEREWCDGELVEIDYLFLAYCSNSGGIFCFGEVGTTYEDGVAAAQEDGWISGVSAQPGLWLPGLPLVGARYYQSVAPRVSMDRGEVQRLGQTVSTPVGTFDGCLAIEESSDFDDDDDDGDDDDDIKIWAPGVGPVKNGNLELVWYEGPR